MRTPLLAIFFGLLAATGACGKKGPLYLPEEKAQAEKKPPVANDTTAPQSAPTASPTPAAR